MAPRSLVGEFNGYRKKKGDGLGTRGAFGVVIGEKEKIGYNQFDSYPSGQGEENLDWLRNADYFTIRQQAEAAKVVGENTAKPTKEEIELLQPWTDTNVHDQSLEDWYCLTRDSHGHIGEMLKCGYIYDAHTFPLDSLFCEWAYIVDFDKEVFEVYQGFQHEVPKQGRWKGRPTASEDEANYNAHLRFCEENNREPWLDETPKYKAVELVAAWPFHDLPSNEYFLAFLADDEHDDE